MSVFIGYFVFLSAILAEFTLNIIKSKRHNPFVLSIVCYSWDKIELAIQLRLEDMPEWKAFFVLFCLHLAVYNSQGMFQLCLRKMSHAFDNNLTHVTDNLLPNRFGNNNRQHNLLKG